MSEIVISFVVDNLPLHYYQAELLLHSIEKFTKIDKKHIIVQCLDRVDKIFIDFLEKNFYQYNLIEPHIDGKYCNKLAQLEYFKDKDIDGALLLDTDMVFVNDININTDKFLAKIVDAPNPTLKTLEDIYNEAKIKFPKRCQTDWVMKDNETFENNFNGGFYFISKKYIATLDKCWKKWANWLYSKPELFELDKQFIHVDQISMGMALQENGVNFEQISANHNCPIHSDVNLSSFDDNDTVKILHYHRELDEFGFLRNNMSNKNIKDAIGKINKSISEVQDFNFYKIYKKSLEPKLNFSKKVIDFEEKIKNLVEDKKLNLILHSGTPKTGTTSIQFFMHNHYEELISNGCLYPKSYINTPAPKHQWIVSCLISNDFDELYAYISDIYKKALELESINTIILSTEGIYNHWWDYSSDAKAALKVLGKYFDAKVWIFYREPSGFLESLYKQYLKNPRLGSVKCYGKDLTFDEMCEDKWFIRHLDYLGFIYDVQYIFGEDSIEVFQYSQEVLKHICERLSLEIKLDDTKRENTALSDTSMELIKIINRLKPNIEDKQKSVEIVSKLDKILKKYDFAVEPTIRINDKFMLQSKILKNDFKLNFKMESYDEIH